MTVAKLEHNDLADAVVLPPVKHMPLERFVGQYRPTPVSTLESVSCDRSKEASGDSPDTVDIYTPRDQLMVNLLYRLRETNYISRHAKEYIDEELEGYQLSWRTLEIPDADEYDKLTVYGHAVAQIVSDRCAKEPSRYTEQEQAEEDKKDRMLQSATWVIANEAMLRKIVYDEVAGVTAAESLTEVLSSYRLYKPTELLESGTSIIEQTAENRNDDASLQLANWAGQIATTQFYIEKENLFRVITPSLGDTVSTKLISGWQKLRGKAA